MGEKEDQLMKLVLLRDFFSAGLAKCGQPVWCLSFPRSGTHGLRGGGTFLDRVVRAGESVACPGLIIY